MLCVVNLYSEKKGEINNFLNKFYNSSLDLENSVEWKKEFGNPIEIAEFIGAFIDNSDDFDIDMWISLDKGLFLNISDDNADDLIKYLFERFPY